MTEQGLRAVVRGRVQGVGFRAATRQQALALKLRGRADNLADGRVEVEVAGDAQAIEVLLRWLQHGPPAARVDAVEVEPLNPAEVLPGFSTGWSSVR